MSINFNVDYGPGARPGRSRRASWSTFASTVIDVSGLLRTEFRATIAFNFTAFN
jgi:hypothetical protein